MASLYSREKQLDITAFLTALSMFFSTLEYLVPKPLPYIRLGLANIPLIAALPVLDVPYYLLLIAGKAIGQAIVNGTLLSYVFLFSIAGSVSSGTLMLLVSRIAKKHISPIGISTLGAFVSNSVQLSLSVLYIFGTSAIVIAPVFLGIGTVSGFTVGLICLLYFKKSQWYKKLIGGKL
ncbi:Gx transporter family protein [Spirochaetia bacterium 38H-sp]|uniref:Gx transporter family protein n=1 Tax=Rarispira pelagica TaxID=3141764 RepID=A0ABU9UBT8_9SPIR